MGISTEFTSTKALAPGYEARTTTIGGEMEGNCEMGSCKMANPPKNKITSATTMASTGRRRNLLNMN